MSSVSNGLYFLTLQLVSVMRVIYRKIRPARYLYIKRNVEKVWGARYTLGARYLSKNTVLYISGCITSIMLLLLILPHCTAQTGANITDNACDFSEVQELILKPEQYSSSIPSI